MDYEKGVDGSYLCNCYIDRRDGDKPDTLFNNQNGTITAFLNGYAIIPIEKYAELVEMASPANAKLKPVIFSMEDIKKAQLQLN